MSLIVLCALLGAAIGGPLGALIGGGIGLIAGNAFKSWFAGNLHIAQSRLIEPTFAVMGALCKADGVVSPDEIKTVEHIFGLLNIYDEQRDQAKLAFRQGKQPGFDLDAAVDEFASASRRRAPLVQLFMQVQCMAVAADGRVDPAEHTMLVRIARRLGMHEADVSQLEALLRAATGRPSAGGGATPPQDRLADAYKALGVSPATGPAEIKRAYRKLISKNHPDKLASRGLPESMRGVAEERSREINSAYDLIKDARNDVR